MKKRRLPLYCSYNKDRHGVSRIRFRQGSFSRYLYEKLGTAEFRREYAEALAGVKPTLGVGEARPGTIALLFAKYYQSPEFQGLAETSKPSHRGILERFKQEHGHRRVSHLTRDDMKAIIGKMADRPNAANNLLKRLSFVLDMAVEDGWIKTNPIKGMRGYKIKSNGHYTWSEDDISAFEDTHPSGTRARLAMALLLYTLSRRYDAILLGKQHVKNGRLRFTQHKTQEPMDIPIHWDLQTEIDQITHNHLTFLVTSKGAPFTPAGFGNWFRKQCDLAGLGHCSAHGLRKAGTRRMIEAGKTIKEAGAVTGHRTLAQVAKYSEKADRAALADRAIDGLNSPKTRTEMSNQEGGLDKIEE